ncbi:glycosyltransferase [Chitinophaga silvatica]|uniref:Glycosyltransferase n=1 Tax=Chitinophaga silvatica TaxID=2282649 RepID=A0A3E1Y9T7_9BACT|nr:glycosyltransferase [Chitinophaga silvatica]RFS22514.1 glycosyltransferase [Chitinophaga silvatica]
MISIVIPVLNEGATIRQVIRTVKKTSRRIEVIVVDDNSTDNTVEEAMKEQVRVITSSQRGKGISMREGMMAAKYDIVAYVDGDILTYPDNIIDLLTNPIENDEADFVKSYFERQAGRVTQLVAKPLLSILYPDLAHFQQPLSGMIAARKSFLSNVHFENDYGVDIGLLIDMHQSGARIVEANIGKIENAMQTWEQLSKMSREVSRTILKKAENIPQENLETLGNINLIREQMEYSILESIDKLQKMVIFNLDQVVFRADYLECAALAFEQEETLEYIRSSKFDTLTSLQLAAQLFEGRNIAELLEIADAIPLVPGIREIVRELKKRGYAVGLITDGFDTIGRHIKNKLGMDFVFANKLHMVNSVATGEFTAAEYFMQGGEYCRSNMFPYIDRQYNINAQNIIYVGDPSRDQELLMRAGVGVAFCPQPCGGAVEKVADKIIYGLSLHGLLEIAPASSKNLKLPSINKRQAKRIGIGSLVALAGAGVLYLAIRQMKKKKDVNRA